MPGSTHLYTQMRELCRIAPHQMPPEFLQPKILHGIESSYGLAGRSGCKHGGLDLLLT